MLPEQFASSLTLGRKKSEPQLFSGMAFPFGGTVLSTFAPKSDEDVIRTSIEMILMTQINERVMNPAFGSRVHDLLFEPSDEILAIALRGAIYDSLGVWEPRIIFGQIEIEFPETNEHRVVIRIPIVLSRPTGAREITTKLELSRETLYNLPIRG